MSTHRRPRPQLSEYSDDDEQQPSSENSSSDAGPDHSDSNSHSDSDNHKSSPNTAKTATSQISFGTLSRAQASLNESRSRVPATTKIPNLKSIETDSQEIPPKSSSHQRRSDLGRSSKNAPTEISSKRAVSRKRTVVDLPSAASSLPRDPRFDAAVNGQFSEHEFRRNYSFLDSYRDDEIKLLNDAIKKSKNDREKEKLVKKLKSMESQRQSQRNKDQLQDLMKNHKKKEREAVKQGKKPFHLKRAEAKKLVLKERFQKLSEKQVENVIARKQKRKAQKERKNMPWERREIR